MTTLAASFLEDMDELSGESENEEDIERDSLEETTRCENRLKEGDDELDAILEDVVEDNKIENIATLRRSERYNNHFNLVQKYLNQPAGIDTSRPLEEDSEYQAIAVSNDFMLQIDEESSRIHAFIIDLYSKKFPELESLVPNCLDYVRVVKLIGNEMDMTKVDLSSVLPSAVVMGVSVTGSTTSGQKLPEDDMKLAMEACDEVLALETDKSIFLQFVESRMQHLAPNMSALVGTRIAARLMGLAGGLNQLSRTPACNIQLFGQEKKILGGFSSASTLRHTGIIYYCDLVQSLPDQLRMKGCRALAGKITLAARVDCTQDDSRPKGSVGADFRSLLENKFDKWQEPDKAKTKKALPIPDEKPRRKRGGKRYRKMKERFGMTDVRKEANRQSFARVDEEYGDNAMGITFGRLGQEGAGNLRVVKKEQKQMAKKLKAASYSSGATSGLSSSLAFTPLEGIELANPEAAEEKLRQANRKYFSSDIGFKLRKPVS